jgi:hypothetical protein
VGAAIEVYPATLWVAPLTNGKWRQTALPVAACGAASIFVWALFAGSVVEGIELFIDTDQRLTRPAPRVGWWIGAWLRPGRRPRRRAGT